ncbi:hypothetical protein DAI22_05g059300 [Oryza sativa Japonica Group]|nr:hypothetical protein DAI22_05g059300 [Oryza sativa Japonica Group]
MTDIAKRDFAELAVSGKNYLTWALDAKIMLGAKKLLNCIQDPTIATSAGGVNNLPTSAEKNQALHFLRHHLNTTLKNEYMTEEDPKVLWDSLKDRYGHQLCGEKITDADMIDKTLSTFHANHVNIQRQYRQAKYEKYSELVSMLIEAQGEDETLVENHTSRPTGSSAAPEANASSFKKGKNQNNQNKGKNFWKNGGKVNKTSFKKKGNQNSKSKKGSTSGEYGKQDQVCFKCGTRGHWSRICRTPKHLIELYQEKHRKKKSEHESHFTVEIQHSEEKMAAMHIDKQVDEKAVVAMHIDDKMEKNAADAELKLSDDLMDSDQLYGDI